MMGELFLYLYMPCTFGTPDHYTNMDFAAITASPPLEWLSTRFWSVPVGMISNSSKRAFVKSATDVWREGLFQFIPKVQWGWGQGSVWASQVLPNKSNHVIMDLALSTRVQSFWNIKGPFSNCSWTCCIEWMNEWIIYIALLLCIALHPKALYNHIGGSLLNHHQCAASTASSIIQNVLVCFTVDTVQSGR